MKQSIPRLARARLKCGTDVVPLNCSRYEDLRGVLIDHARTIAGYYGPDEIAGFVVVAWDADGHPSIGYRIDETRSFNRNLLPSVLADTMRRALIESGGWRKL